MSHQTAIEILHENQFKYQSYNKEVRLTQEDMKERLNFTRGMKRRESDWCLIAFSDECSFWRINMKPNKVWTTDPLKEEGIGTKGIKVHCWGCITARGALQIEIF